MNGARTHRPVRKLMAILVAACISTSAFAASLEVRGITADTTANLVTIKGVNLIDATGHSPKLVLLGALQLPVVSASGDQIVASLPSGIAPGSYRLTVGYGAGNTQSDQFDLTLGAAGPQGPKGDV